MTPLSVSLFGIGSAPIGVATFGLSPTPPPVASSAPFVYDPRYHTFESWASLMVEHYAANQLQIPGRDTDWKIWGNGLKAIDVFNNESIPETTRYEDWLDWATVVMNSVTQINN